MIVLLVSVLQVSYMLFGFGMDPTMVANLDTSYATTAYSHLGVRSVFVNTNDLAVVGCLCLFYIMYGCSLETRSVVLATISIGTVVALSGSRGGFVVLVSITAIYYLTSWRRMVLATGAIAAFCMLLWLFLLNSNFLLADSYFFTKLSTITGVVSQYFAGGVQGVTNDSASLRLGTYYQFLGRFWGIGIGSFSAKNYGYLIKGDWLMAQDPHSLPIELALLYGYLGIVAFALIMAWMFTVIGKSCGRLKALAFCILFLYCALRVLRQ